MPRVTKQTPQQRRPPPPEPLGVFWMLVAALALVASIGIFACAAFPDWRISDAFITHYYDSTKNYFAQSYNPSKFGLFSMSFNGGVTTEAWYQKATRVCSGIQTYAPIGGLIGVFVNSPCPAACVAHFRTRCVVYNKLVTFGYVALGSSIIVGLLALVGVAWLVVFGLAPALLQIFWLGGGIANLFAIGAWLYETDNGMKQLALQSQYPYPSIGPACSGSVAFSLILFGLGIIVTLSTCVKDSGICGGTPVDEGMANEGPDDFNAIGAFAPGAQPFGSPRHGPPPGFGGPMQHGPGLRPPGPPLGAGLPPFSPFSK